MFRKHWEKKSPFRKNLSLKNKVLLVLQETVERDKITYHEAIEMFITSSPLFDKAIEKLKEDYPDL